MLVPCAWLRGYCETDEKARRIQQFGALAVVVDLTGISLIEGLEAYWINSKASDIRVRFVCPRACLGARARGTTV